MYSLLKQHYIRTELLKRNIRVFTPAILGKIFQLSYFKTRHLVDRETKNGFFIRLKNGLYVVASDVPGEELLANLLYQPSYISFEYALAYYGLLTEMPYVITSVTTKATRTFTVLNKTFSYRNMKISTYTGYNLTKSESESFLIAEAEKAFLDYYYFVTLDKIPPNERLHNLAINKLDKKNLLTYLPTYHNKQLVIGITKLFNL